MTARPNISLDKIRGMLIGAFCGDSLGAPNEFRCNGKTPYTGILEHKGFMNTQFQGRKELAVAQITDDSELTITLLRSIIQNKGYNKEHVIMEYLKWANSGVWMMGKNTRALLKGVTTLKGYQNRINKILALPMSERSQSNGAMMRCSPLALIWDNIPVIQDVEITNPNPICKDCNLVYVSALRFALLDTDVADIFKQCKIIAQTDEVKAVLDQVEKRETRNIAENKGWCLHALWCAMMTIISFTNYSDAMNWIITSQPGSDTDTNACIAGALLGAKIGFENLKSEPLTAKNIEILLHADINNGPTPRPSEYQPHDFYEFTEALHSVI